MGTKNNPGKYDCYANALPDEPMFVLLARDKASVDAIGEWIKKRLLMIASKEKPLSDMQLILEAVDCMSAMIDWRAKNVGKWRQPGTQKNMAFGEHGAGCHCMKCDPLPQPNINHVPGCQCAFCCDDVSTL